MRVGILFADTAPPELEAHFGPLLAQFMAMIEPDLNPVAYRLLEQEFPSRVDECDAYVLSGSDAGVHDDHPWLERLRRFLPDAQARVPMVGICFGHQLMADTFGGRAARSPCGWGRGFHRYEVVYREPWLDAGDTLTMAVSHQDQVETKPPQAQVIARSAFTPFAALAYPDRKAISFQGHPEHSPEFCAALIELRRPTIGPEADKLIQSTKIPNDRIRIIKSINEFLRDRRPVPDR